LIVSRGDLRAADTKNRQLRRFFCIHTVLAGTERIFYIVRNDTSATERLFHRGFPGEVAVVVVPQGTRNEKVFFLYPAHCTGFSVWGQ
jgi:hypothetical protein